MRICVLGASGFVGGAVYNFFRDKEACDVIGTYHSSPRFPGLKSTDVTVRDDLKRLFSDGSFDYILWCVGNKNVRFCEENPDAARIINAEAVGAALDVLREIGAVSRFVYVSTDYVFDGERGGYNADDPCAPRTAYGKTKLLAEHFIQESGIDAKIVRLAALMGSGGTFFDWLTAALCGSEPLEMFDNTFFTPTPLSFFQSCMQALLSDYENWAKVIHMNAPERVSRYHLAAELSRRIGGSASLLPVQADFAGGLFQKDLSLVPSPQVAALCRGSLIDALYREWDYAHSDD